MITLAMLAFSALTASAQGYFDVITQPVVTWNGGNFTWDEATCNLGQFVCGPSGNTLRLVGNPATINAQTGTITASADADLDGDGDWTPDPAVACNHNSNVAVLLVTNNAGHTQLSMSVILLSNSPLNGMINMPGLVLNSTLPAPQVSWPIPNDPHGNLPSVENVSAAMDNQFLYIAYMYETNGGPGWEYYYAVVSLGDNPQLVNGPMLILPPGGGPPAIGESRPTVACNRWQHSTGNGVVAFTYQNTGGRFQPAIVFPDNGPGSAANLLEPAGASNCLWVRVVDYDNQPWSALGSAPDRHYFYAYNNSPGTDLYSTDNATVWGPVTTTLITYSPGGVYIPSPGVGDGYINHSVYCDYVDEEAGIQKLRVILQECGVNQLVASGGYFNIFSLGCNQMGVFIPYNNGGPSQMWRAFWPFEQDIVENTLATGLTKVLPNLNMAILGIGVDNRTNLQNNINDTLRINQDFSGAEDFQFAQNPPPQPPGPIALWAGEIPTTAVDVDNGTRGCIIMDNTANIDFTNTPGVILHARSDGSIVYNGANFTNLAGDFIGADGETRVQDASIIRRGIWFMDASCTINGAGTFGGVKGFIDYADPSDNIILNLEGQNAALNCDTMSILFSPTSTTQAKVQIYVTGTPPSQGDENITFTFTNGLMQLRGPYEVAIPHDQLGSLIGPGDCGGPVGDPCPGTCALVWLFYVHSTNISNNTLVYTWFDFNTPMSTSNSVQFESNDCWGMEHLLSMYWGLTDGTVFAGQASILNNTVENVWPLGSDPLNTATTDFYFDGFNVADQHRLMIDDNTMYHGWTNWESTSTAIYLNDGTNADVTGNSITDYGIGIDDNIQGSSDALLCSNQFHQTNCNCGPHGIGIIEEGDKGLSYTKLNEGENLDVGYLAEGYNGSNLIENAFASGNVGARFADYAATLLYGSHGGTDDYPGWNQFENNIVSQVQIEGNSTNTVQPSFGLPAGGDLSDIDNWGQNIFVAPQASYYFSYPGNNGQWNTLVYPITGSQWSPSDIAYNRNPGSYNQDPMFDHIEYRNVEDGTAAEVVFECGGGFQAKKGKGASPLSVQSNPVDTSDPAWLYWEAMQWDKIDPQKGLDTMKLFVERDHSVEGFAEQGIGMTVSFTWEFATQESHVITQDWINEYNWLVSIYNLDTAYLFNNAVIANMAACANYLDLNLEANLWYNFSLLYPDSMDVALAFRQITSIRNHQRIIPEDTTPFYKMQIPPVPYGASSVTDNAPPSVLNVAINPNPANGLIGIRIQMPAQAVVAIGIYDGLGRQVTQLSNGNLMPGMNALSFDCSTIPTGHYFLRVFSGSGVRTLPLVIEH